MVRSMLLEAAGVALVDMSKCRDELELLSLHCTVDVAVTVDVGIVDVVVVTVVMVLVVCVDVICRGTKCLGLIITTGTLMCSNIADELPVRPLWVLSRIWRRNSAVYNLAAKALADDPEGTFVKAPIFMPGRPAGDASESEEEFGWPNKSTTVLFGIDNASAMLSAYISARRTREAESTASNCKFIT